MPIYMLDTNILSDAIRNPFGRTQDYIDRFDESAICTSAIVASEMRYGAMKKGSARLIERVEMVLAWIAIMPYDNAAARVYGHVRNALERKGTPIGWGDVFIASHAMSLDLVLVTDNVREFSRVDGLRIENWIKREETP